jgi:spore maturation protein CgeB
MRILIVGPDKIFSIENFYAHYLADLGIDVRRFPSQNIFYDYYRKGLLNKIMYRTGFSGIYGKINQMLLENAMNDKPDVVWVFKGMEIFPRTLQALRDRGIKLINYNPDNPFIFSGTGSGNENITKSIGLYDLHFTYNLAVKDRLEAEFGARVSFLPFGFDVSQERYDACAKEVEVLRICFLGNPDKGRAEFIKAISKEGLPLTVFGHGWSSFLKDTDVMICDAVYGEEQWRVLRRYRVQLNLMRIHNVRSHNMRTFEVPAIGGIMLAPNNAEHESFFNNGHEAFFFTDLWDCFAKGKYLLELPAPAAREIRTAARARSVASGYSYQARAEFALCEIKRVVS